MILSAAVLLISITTLVDGGHPHHKLRRRAQNTVRCGTSPKPGFANFHGDDTYDGFDVDLCHAIAAATLGDASAIDIIESTRAKRFMDLDASNFDVLFMTTTHTLSRDMNETSTKKGFSFSMPYFYDGLKFAGTSPYGSCADTLNVEGDCTDLKLCINQHATWYPITQGLFPKDNVIPVEETADYVSAIENGKCNAIGGETSDVVYETMKQNGYTGAEADWQVGSNVYSKEPLAMVTRQDDPVWSDMVYWVLQVLMMAEENGVTRDMVASGESVLTPDWANDIVEAVGNYGEMYERSLESIVPRGGMNTLNNNNGPMQYPWPGIGF